MQRNTPQQGKPSENSYRHDTSLTAFQRECLRIVGAEARYGLAIKRELEARYGKEVNHGRLYPNLDQLIEMGLVEKSALDKRTNQYAATDAGLELLAKMLKALREDLESVDQSLDEGEE